MFLNLVQTNSKPVDFFTVVKKLCLTHAVHRDTACGILAACTQVESLACWIDFGTAVELPFLISKLPLRQLSIGAPNLTKIPRAAPAAWLAGLTHVDLISVAGYTAASISGLARLPHLTHVCLDTYHLGGMEENVARVCAECPLLQVLVLFEDWSSESPAFLDHTDDIDSRIVVKQKPWDYVEHWRNSAEMWATVEETVEEQRA
ncbi:hypothetical protein R3P38DRAFT_2831499 [Favolaschia claudopus]|uniref:Uncharacterized protein n=1 Tax=Favolaschia claudopus TaxID=2862362 RepID=A0AAW0E8K2_9AGAR